VGEGTHLSSRAGLYCTLPVTTAYEVERRYVG